ncbi:myotubularin-related protein 12 isoform X3 [Malaya genurostris]|uniref:myotubularin-related protein 12 isoform X3 n=1 Tax=Malaya genurostris TaxID=325434 RepID=UPI0026F3AA71|nr:myotubularin-related protein 12 isoform X3 [Malaya genurostris]
MNELRNKQKENFTSYVKEDLYERVSSEYLNPKLLSGEIEAARVNNVVFYTTYCAKDNKFIDEKEGALIITNFRLSFLCDERENDQVTLCQKNAFLGKYDISLSNIDRIYQVTEKKWRMVGPDIKNSSKIEILKVICKVWSIGNAALVRMAELSPEIASFTIENTMLEHVRKCDPLKKAPHLMELSKLLPSIQEVNLSYLKLRKLCIPENDSEFMAQDSRFHLLLDKTYWLLYVSVCLKQSVAAAKMLMNGCSVVLQEINSRDMCCVLASLVQLLLDNSFRTIDGLQTLIQKEWISLGHPFSDRIGHVTDENSTERSPIFLLFLDCVWQLLQQFPEEFEFSETFLTSIWDCVFLPIFDTFQFNSETERHIAQLNDRIILRPAWDWEEQFSDKDIALFSNPLYKKTVNEESAQGHKLRLSPSVYRYPFMEESSNDFACASGTYTDTSDIQPQSMFLQPQFTLRDVEVWHQCYYRWIPFLEIKNGGHPQIDFFNRSVLDNIYKLEKIVQTGQIFESSEEIHLQSEVESKSENKTNIEMELNECTLPIINSFFPFTNHMTNMEELLDVLVINSEFLNDGSIVDCASINE